MISPGNSIGTTFVNGPLFMSPGSIARIEFSPINADFINMSGQAALTGAHIALRACLVFTVLRQITQFLTRPH